MAGKGRPFISKLSVPGKGSDELSYVFFDALKDQYKDEILLFGLFTITSSSAVYRTFIKQTVKHFLDFYHRTPTSVQQTLDRDGIQSAEFLFESALQYTHQHVTEQLTAPDEEGNAPQTFDVKKINFLLGAIVGDSLYLCSGGTAINSLYIYPIFKKEGFSHYKVLDILADGKSMPEGLARLYSNYMSGRVSIPGSILVLCNRALMDYLTPDQLKSTVTNIPAHQLPVYFENLFGKVHSRFDFSALFIHPHYAGPTDRHDRQQTAPNRSMEGLNSTARGTSTILSPSAATPVKQTIKSISDTAMSVGRWISPLLKKGSEQAYILYRRGMKHLAAIEWNRVLPLLVQHIKTLGVRLSHTGEFVSGLIDSQRRKQLIESLTQRIREVSATAAQRTATKFRNLSIASKVLLLLSVLFIGLFVQSIFSLQAKKALARDQAAVQELIRAAELKCDLAEASILYADDLRARSIASEAQSLIALIPVRNDTTSERDRLTQRIQAITNKVDRVTEVSNPQLLATFTDKIPTPDQLRILGAQANFAILSTADALYNIHLTSGDLTTIDTQAKLPLIGCGTMADANKLFACSGEGLKLSEVNLKENTVKPVTLPAEKNEQQIKDLTIYNKRLYILDGNRVYRHMPSDDGFARGVIASEATNAASARAIAIDGAIYMLTGDNTIVRFSGSKQEAFPLPGLTPPIGKITRMITADDMSALYVLDQENARIIVIDKASHELKGQIRSSTLSQPRDFAVLTGKSSQKILVLDGSNLYLLKVSL